MASSDIITGQRTFFLGVSAVAGANTHTSVAIPFRDSAGNLIKCNYFKVETAANAANASGIFVAELSGVPIFRTVGTTNVVYNVTSLPGSGICGVGGTIGGGTGGVAEWHGCNGDVCTGINLRFISTQVSQFFAITYGNLLPYNVLRSDSYDKGR